MKSKCGKIRKQLTRTLTLNIRSAESESEQQTIPYWIASISMQWTCNKTRTKRTRRRERGQKKCICYSNRKYTFVFVCACLSLFSTSFPSFSALIPFIQFSSACTPELLLHFSSPPFDISLNTITRWLYDTHCRNFHINCLICRVACVFQREPKK